MTDVDCVFCKIVANDSPGRVLYRDELVTAFRDIHPIASIHYLIVPNRHIASVNELEETDQELMGHMVLTAQKIARQEGFADKGYRLLMNTGPLAGQTVFHLHLHLISGRFTRFILGKV